jgi:hypothetical protein
VVLRSADPGLPGLPWELMRDGAGPVVTGQPEPEAVRDYITSHHDEQPEP